MVVPGDTTLHMQSIDGGGARSVVVHSSTCQRYVGVPQFYYLVVPPLSVWYQCQRLTGKDHVRYLVRATTTFLAWS